MMAAVAVGAYVVALVWVLSPLWSSAEDLPARVPERSATADRRLGFTALDSADSVPSKLPGSALPTTVEGSASSSGNETESAGFANGAETGASTESGGSVPSSPSSEGSSQGASKTVIGFEG
jgi:hypothetical protein